MGITFHECYLEYLQRPDAIQFSKKKINRLTNHIKNTYDYKKGNPPISYIESQEGDKTYQVRLYPQTFKNTIVGLLNRLHEKEKEKVFNTTLVPKRLLEDIRDKIEKPIINPAPIKFVSMRKRKPINKPAFSAKPNKL